MIKLNLARNCLRYVIRIYGIKEIFMPFYSCETLWHAARAENCHIKFYHVDQNFVPVVDFPHDAFILYINYFGLCGNVLYNLAEKYPNLIADNTQAFYEKPCGLASFCSLRKFFKVQNGAYLYTCNRLKEEFPTDESCFSSVFMHEDYDKFVRNELFLNSEGIKYISKDVTCKMRDFDYEKDKLSRIKLFNNYAQFFDKYNLIKLPLRHGCIPYCYPFRTNSAKIQKRLSDFILLKLWDKDDIIAMPLCDEDFSNNILNSFS